MGYIPPITHQTSSMEPNAPNTHQLINQELCGEPLEISEKRSIVRLQTIDVMAVDAKGLVHGGFIFGMADYAAMIAVNDPNVVLGASEVKFLKPVRVGDVVVATADVIEAEGKKQIVKVTVKRNEETLFSGSFTCFVLNKHVLG